MFNVDLKKIFVDNLSIVEGEIYYTNWLSHAYAQK